MICLFLIINPASLQHPENFSSEKIKLFTGKSPFY